MNSFDPSTQTNPPVTASAGPFTEVIEARDGFQEVTVNSVPTRLDFTAGVSVLVAHVDDDPRQQLVVQINTERMPAHLTYDDATGLRGDAQPYRVVPYDALNHMVLPSADEPTCSAYQVLGPSRGGSHTVVIAEYPVVENYRHDAKKNATLQAEVLNSTWSEERCGMPVIQVAIGDGEVYDDEGEGDQALTRWSDREVRNTIGRGLAHLDGRTDREADEYATLSALADAYDAYCAAVEGEGSE